MIICFDCLDEKKRELDRLIAEGKYRSYSEFISLAIVNQLLLHSQFGAASGLVIQSAIQNEQASGGRQPSSKGSVETRGGIAPTSGQRTVIDPFRVPDTSIKRPPFAGFSDDVFMKGEAVPPERWIFGQFNRLLPAKASCRALGNMLSEESEGVELNAASVEIARSARLLGMELERRDLERGVDRDDQLAIAFPLAASAEKGISRFANQFVGNVSNRGQLSGLLVALKLIGRTKGNRKGVVSLTEAGWNFALLKNPCIDSQGVKKFSAEEREFLCGHIGENVPQEASAYTRIVQLANSGGDTPKKLDKVLQKFVSPSFEASASFIATQRSGVISRMTDLGLIGRERDGTRVRYVVTEYGKAFA